MTGSSSSLGAGHSRYGKKAQVMCLMTTSVEAMPRRPCDQKSQYVWGGEVRVSGSQKSHINPFDISFFSSRHFGGWTIRVTAPVDDCCDRLKTELSRSVKVRARNSSWHRLVRSVGPVGRCGCWLVVAWGGRSDVAGYVKRQTTGESSEP